MMLALWITRWSMLVICLAAGGGTAIARQTLVVFPFELLDTSQEEDFMLKVRPEETARLALLTQDLKTRIAALKPYQLAEIPELEADIKAAAPLHKCNGCEIDLAKKSGAKFAILGLVQKFSDTLLSVRVQLLDAETGTLVHSYSAAIQGNTDEAWLRGVSYIVRNKLGNQETPQ